MCSDSESAGGSSESRSMDSPTASPGTVLLAVARTQSLLRHYIICICIQITVKLNLHAFAYNAFLPIIIFCVTSPLSTRLTPYSSVSALPPRLKLYALLGKDMKYSALNIYTRASQLISQNTTLLSLWHSVVKLGIRR